MYILRIPQLPHGREPSAPKAGDRGPPSDESTAAQEVRCGPAEVSCGGAKFGHAETVCDPLRDLDGSIARFTPENENRISVDWKDRDAGVVGDIHGVGVDPGRKHDEQLHTVSIHQLPQSLPPPVPFRGAESGLVDWLRDPQDTLNAAYTLHVVSISFSVSSVGTCICRPGIAALATIGGHPHPRASCSALRRGRRRRSGDRRNEVCLACSEVLLVLSCLLPKSVVAAGT